MVKRLLPASSARNAGQQKVTDSVELGTLEKIEHSFKKVTRLIGAFAYSG